MNDFIECFVIYSAIFATFTMDTCKKKHLCAVLAFFMQNLKTTSHCSWNLIKWRH